MVKDEFTNFFFLSSRYKLANYEMQLIILQTENCLTLNFVWLACPLLEISCYAQ